MNKERRKTLQEIIDVLEEQKSGIDAVCEEEQEAYDNLPEGIQDSERGEAMSENIDSMESAASDLDDIITALQEIIER